jgi:hypothetical protein
MKIIPSEAWKIASLTKKSLILTPEQKLLVAGTLLGDGTLEKNGINYRLKIQQSIDQKEYVWWKHGKLGNWVISEPHYQAVNQSWRFRTVTHPELSIFRNQFYSGNRKIIPQNIEEYLRQPLVLAVWFMDDGNKITRKGAMFGWNLNSHSFSADENKRLADILKYHYGLSVGIDKNHGKYRLRINKSSHSAFFKLIDPYIIRSMRYKIELG